MQPANGPYCGGYRPVAYFTTLALMIVFLSGCGRHDVGTASRSSVPASMPSAVVSPSVVPDAPTTLANPLASSPTAAVRAAISASLTAGAGRPCRGADLDLETGHPVSEPTGQHTISLTLTNRTAHACSLFGYPQVRLLDAAGEELPFEFRHQGDQVVTSAKPTKFELAPGADAYLTLNKYRCDLGDRGVVSSLQLLLSDDQTALGLSIPSRSSVFGYCGANDPGSVVSTSPLEATFRATLSH